jgi:hypothetical protein
VGNVSHRMSKMGLVVLGNTPVNLEALFVGGVAVILFYCVHLPYFVAKHRIFIMLIMKP